MKRKARIAVAASAIAAAITCALATTSVAASAHPTGAKAPAHHPTELQVVLGLDQKIANEVVAGNVKAVSAVLAPTFQMTHGAQWVNGGTPSLVDNKTSFLTRVANHGYTCIKFDDIQAELHGNVAITYGRYLASEAGTEGTANAYFVVWFERVYEKEGNQWIYLSHRTVNGPHFGATVADAMAGMGPADPALTCP